MIFKRFNCLNFALVAALSFFLNGCSDDSSWTPLSASTEEDPAFESADLVATIWTVADTVRWKQKADIYANLCDTLVQIGVAQNGSIAITWPSLPDWRCTDWIEYADLLAYRDGVLLGSLRYERIIRKTGSNSAIDHQIRYANLPQPLDLSLPLPAESGTIGQWSYTDLVLDYDISCAAGWCPIYLELELDLAADALVKANARSNTALAPSGLKWYFLKEGEMVMIVEN
jgi:hypothetical protein